MSLLPLATNDRWRWHRQTTHFARVLFEINTLTKIVIKWIIHLNLIFTLSTVYDPNQSHYVVTVFEFKEEKKNTENNFI